MDYILTFEDGSSAYLAHHGVKGMKWGVWNAETRAKFAGGDSSRRGAKKTIKTLNRLDKRRAVEVGKMLRADKKAVSLAKAGERQGKKGKIEKSVKTVGKANRMLKTAEAHENAVKGIEKQQKALSSKLIKEGYSVKTRNVTRSTLTKGEKVLRAGLVVAMAASPSPVVVYTDERVSGTKYKLQKSK